MTEHVVITPPRSRWGRLLSAEDAAEYLGIGITMLRGLGIKTKPVGRRVMWDRLDLDRWVDRISEQPILDADQGKEQEDEEARFFERRRGRARH
ncbi:DNA-binding protein [Sphingomonas aerophila]|uniref:Helix-turn-helix domain-containing protein n=1 Tax=Sphingomonas aerophila TaxID=1344948 RepID=A0A7W9BCL3_9SPHN|nr:DNA-binding protein [Sphingomonas aerophila]MBB5714745.1 hypothetical protein [Sphingomonas aerophila]